MISPDTIARVKERTDLVALIGSHMRLQKRGRSYVGLCPFHNEKSPSFHVHPERGFFYCFGCKASGSAIDFVERVFGLSFPEAVRDLADRAGIQVEETGTDAERKEADARRKAKEDLYAVNQLAAEFYERQLDVDGDTGHEHAGLARQELEKRGMPGEPGPARDAWLAACRAFRIGYAPPEWDGLAGYLRKQGISPALSERAGLLVPRSSGTGHYDRFRHRLMFAVVDALGRVVAFSGRALPDPPGTRPPPDGQDRHVAKYINSPESPVYTKGQHLFGLYQAKSAIRQEENALLVEGNFDVFALHARGLEHAIAPLGTALTEEQATLIKRFAPSVVILFDADTAGRQATRKARVPCRKAGLSAKVARLPEGADPDDFARENGIKALAERIDGAKGMLEFLIEEALASDAFAGGSMQEQAARIQVVARLLAEEQDPSLRQLAKLYADRLSSRLIVAGKAPEDLRSLERLIERATGGAEEHEDAAARPAKRAREPPRARLERMILGALFDFPELLDAEDAAAGLEELEGDFALAVAALRQMGERAFSSGNTEELLAALPQSIHSFAARRAAAPELESRAEAIRVLLANAEKLRQLKEKHHKAHLEKQLGRGDLNADSEIDLLREIQESARKRMRRA